MTVRSYETSEELSRALGEAVVRIWGACPPTYKTVYSKRL